LLLPIDASALEAQGWLTDLSDTTPGEDLWQASYEISDWNGYGANYGFSIALPLTAAEYTQLGNASGGGNWTTVALQVDAEIPADGALDARALVSTPDVTQQFTIEFVWTGTGESPTLPDAMTIYDSQFLELTQLTVQAPEPGATASTAAVLLTLALLAQIRRQRNPAGAYRSRGRRSRLSSLVLLCGLGLLPGTSSALDPVEHSLVLGDYDIIFTLRTDLATRSSQAEFNYPVRVTVTNQGSDNRSFSITVWGIDANTIPVQSTTFFAGLANGETSFTEDITLRHDRRYPFDPTQLYWQLDYVGGVTCTANAECPTGHCQNGYCCLSGDCCGSDLDCDAYDAAPACLVAPTCQGNSAQGICNPQNQCETQFLDDDSGCDSLVEANTCYPYLPVYCSGATDQSAPTCPSTCASNADCAASNYCDGSNSCVPKEANGSVCATSSACQSGYCSDSRCCDSACDGTCESCNLPGNVGSCLYIAAGQDPDSECLGFSCDAFYWAWSGRTCYYRADVSASTATCNGAGACQAAGSLCPSQGQGSIFIICDPVCQVSTGGTCSGTTAGTCTNVNPGTQTCGIGECERTVDLCVNGVQQTCIPGQAVSEICNGLDDDCDGIVDDNLSCP